ncbi:hypothetical protein EIN_246910 [Entamoeba invadens IP1]|uniref:Uncharacterized protein n=1 Tax=Entamoeba invadens IP1 TaxID=370355 RepID=A0A0A1UH68_ENTIV|nr:hypothetical protein EIN_246910 [Entamoeba invadens IP1]ELP94797.1 hypothetical protein EIN_246910 [Entamoeba invadens IP1]|eukprot:XP_004261568.1 hypothetical protein EIN_246910 [Entamoeba invadens IP1]
MSTFLSCATGRRKDGTLFVVPSDSSKNQTLFEMVSPDVETQTCVITITSVLGVPSKGRDVCLTVELSYPFRLIVQDNPRVPTRWQFSNKKLWAFPNMEKEDEIPFGMVDIIQFKGSAYFALLCAPLYASLSEKSDFSLFAKIDEKRMRDDFFLSLINEIPNVDVIPGTPYFRAILSLKKPRRVTLRFVRNEDCEQIIMCTGAFDYTTRLIFGKWYLSLSNNEIVWCNEEKEALNIKRDKYGRLCVVKDGKVNGFIVLGKQRDEESYFLKFNNLGEMESECKLVAIMQITEEKRDAFVFTDGCWKDNESRFVESKSGEGKEEFLNNEDVELDEELCKDLCVINMEDMKRESEGPTEKEIQDFNDVV